MTTVHRGPSKLLISIDVGATNSAVAWQYLQSDKVVPLPTNVAQWPGPQDGHRVKIPSSILYRNREAVKFGLDAEDEVDLGLGEHLIKNPSEQPIGSDRPARWPLTVEASQQSLFSIPTG